MALLLPRQGNRQQQWLNRDRGSANVFFGVTRTTGSNNIVQGMCPTFRQRNDVVLRQSSFRALATIVTPMVLRGLNFHPLSRAQGRVRRASLGCSTASITRPLYVRMGGAIRLLIQTKTRTIGTGPRLLMQAQLFTMRRSVQFSVHTQCFCMRNPIGVVSRTSISTLGRSLTRWHLSNLRSWVRCGAHGNQPETGLSRCNRYPCKQDVTRALRIFNYTIKACQET